MDHRPQRSLLSSVLLFLLRSIRVPYTCTPLKSEARRANFSPIATATAVTAPKETKDEHRPALSTASSKQRLPYYPVFAARTDGETLSDVQLPARHSQGLIVRS